jgi:hypothetical protein
MAKKTTGNTRRAAGDCYMTVAQLLKLLLELLKPPSGPKPQQAFKIAVTHVASSPARRAGASRARKATRRGARKR